MTVSRKGKNVSARRAAKTKSASRSGSDVWLEYLAFCNKHALTSWWYRGVGDCNHTLMPKIGREYPGKPWTKPLSKTISPFDYEKRVFHAFQRRTQLELGGRERSELEWLAIAQHNGVPTRLLDWTTNPLVAAWFALDCAEPVEDQVARVYAVSVKRYMTRDATRIHPFELKGSTPTFVVAPHWHPRVRAQRGCFSIHPIPNGPLDVDAFDHDHFEIPQIHWRAFRRRLFYFGVDASTIKLDLPGLGESLAWQLNANVGVAAVGC